MDFSTKSDIATSFHRIEELLECGIFERQNSRNPLVRSALTELLILVRDLMAKAKVFAEPIEFSDDVNVTERVKTVSDAIKFVRDAICHVNSENRTHEELSARLSYNIAYGKTNLVKTSGVEIKSDYADDVCFFFGNQKLYLRRHIMRAYEEVKGKLSPLVENA